MTRAWLLTSALALGTIAASASASCATTTNDDDPGKEDASAVVPSGDAAPTDGADASIPPCESVDWCIVPTPMSARWTFTSVWGTSKTDVWAVGSGGTILHYDGEAWTATQSDHLDTFFDVWGSSPTDVWVVSSSQLVLHSTGASNGEVSWSNRPLATMSNARWYETAPQRVYAIWGSGPDDVRVGTEASRISVASPDDSAFSYIGEVVQFLKTSGGDAGAVQWRAMPSNGERVLGIWGSSPTDVWMTVENTKNVTYESGVTLHGTPWQGGRPNPAALEGEVCNGCAPGCHACAVVDDPLVWTPVDSQSQVALESVWGSSAGDVWAVGRRGTIRRIRTGDARWQIVESPTTETLHRVWGSGPNDVWMVGDNGTILHFDGTSITPSSAQFPPEHRPTLRGVWGSGPDDVWIVGDAIALHFTGRKKDAP